MTKLATIDQKVRCEMCADGISRWAEYDGKTRFGSWAYMCQKYFCTYGIGLGLGKGQKLIVK